MIKAFLGLALFLFSSIVRASLIDQYFKDQNGETIWQYVANFTGGVLLILLSIALIILIWKHLQAKRANKALQDMRNALEVRVVERTKDLQATTEQLKFSEGYIQDILESMPMTLIGLDRELRITRWNHEAETLTGVSKVAAIGLNLWEVFPTISLNKNQLMSVIDGRETMVIKHSQRGRFYYDVTVYPLSDTQDGGIVILIHDVTERIMAENMLVQRDRMSTMGEFAATMARDIDSPLQILSVDIDQVASNIGTDTANADLLRDAVTRIQQARAVINNLLGFASASEAEKQSIDIIELVDHTLELGSELLTEGDRLHFRDVNIVRNYEQNIPPLLCASTELQQAILGILRHSLRAMVGLENQRQPEVQIELMECYDALWMRIHHNGRGLNGEQQQQVFEPFFLNDKTVADAFVPLSFSHFIITERHRGQIAVTSDVNLGTTFHIQLPLVIGNIHPNEAEN